MIVCALFILISSGQAFQTVGTVSSGRRSSLARGGSAPILSLQARRTNKHPIGGDQESGNNSLLNLFQSTQKNAATVLLGLSLLVSPLAAVTTFPSAALASTDPSQIVGCLFQKCSVQLGKCVLNPKCLANVVCINTCTGRPDEIECQIKCGDIFENPVVGEFNSTFVCSWFLLNILKTTAHHHFCYAQNASSAI